MLYIDLILEPETTNERCGLCGRVMSDIGTFSDTHFFCPTCGIENGPSLGDGYDRAQDYVSPDGEHWYLYYSTGVWQCIDNDANCEHVDELALPGDLMTWNDWREKERQRKRIHELYGDVSQLSLLEVL